MYPSCLSVLRRAAGALALGLFVPMAAQANTSTLQRAQLSAGIHIINAEVANSEDARRTGLMNRAAMASSDGMLFVFDAPDQQCFWMRNTLIPLSIAFIADDGTITNLADMAPQTETPHCSKGAVRYALEMNQGWFAERGIVSGTRINGLP